MIKAHQLGYCCSRSFWVNSVLKSLFSSFNHEKTIFCRVRLRTKKKMISNKFYERALIIIVFFVSFTSIGLLLNLKNLAQHFQVS